MTPTPEGKQLAADLANAEGGKVRWDKDNFTGLSPTQVPVDAALVALARLATEHLALEQRFAAKDAQLEEALADLQEIDRLIDGGETAYAISRWNAFAAIAVKWRVETDPLLIEAREIVAASDDMVASNVRAGEWDNSHILKVALAALKRGYEIGGKS